MTARVSSRAPGTSQSQRRHALLALAGLSAWALAPRAAWAQEPRGSVRLAAAWEQRGSFHIGLLSTRYRAGQALGRRWKSTPHWKCQHAPTACVCCRTER